MFGGRSARNWESKSRPANLAGRTLGIDAGDFRAEAGSDHGPGQVGGRDLPDREQRLETGSGELLFTIGADVGQKKIAESHRFDAFCDR